MTSNIRSRHEDAARKVKPRLGESADAVWAAVKAVSGGVVEPGDGYRLTYPTLRVVAGQDFRVDVTGRLQVVDKSTGGLCARDATDREADGFHQDLNADRVQVLTLTSPGYASGHGPQRFVRELHSPSGNSFTRASFVPGSGNLPACAKKTPRIVERPSAGKPRSAIA